MSEDWRRSLDKREAIVAVAIDLSKAFDSIDHSLLLAKLGAYGLSSSALHNDILLPDGSQIESLSSWDMF